MNNKEGNELIAEFMGTKYRDYHSAWEFIMPVVEKIESMGYDTEMAKGNAESNYGCQSFIIGNDFVMGWEHDEDGRTIVAESLTEKKIDAVYEAIIEFLEKTKGVIHVNT